MKIAALSLLLLLGPQAQQKPPVGGISHDHPYSISICDEEKCGFIAIASPQPTPETFTHTSEKDGFIDYTLHLHPEWNCVATTNALGSSRYSPTMIQVVCVKKEQP